MKKVTILGAGSWGSALALVLADNGHDVRIWSHTASQVEEINGSHTNKQYLPEVVLPENIVAYTEMEQALEDVSIVIAAVPTKAMREVLSQLKEKLLHAVTIVHVSKGIEPDTFMRVSEIIEEIIPASLRDGVVVLSGPSHAEEVSRRQPTTVTASSRDMKAAEAIQDLFINQNFRVYTNPDIIGVEIGGSLKNIIALGAGLTDGLGYGDNAKAALMTRGLAEIARLGTKMGANPITFSGLAGIGDLIVTCTSVHSRNWRAGNMLGKGKSLDEVLSTMGMVVEGVRTTKAAYHMAQKENVKMPITEALYHVLFNGTSPKEAVDELMTRMKTHEMEDLTTIYGENVK